MDTTLGQDFELIEAAKNGEIQCVKRLLRNGVYVGVQDKHGATALHLASRRGDVRVLDLLMRSGADIDVKDRRGWTALHEASSRGHEESVRLLTHGMANVNLRTMNGNSPLHLASECGHVETVRWLLRAQADCDLKLPDSRTPVHKAARQGHASVLRLLMADAADPDLQSKDGETPLHMAALSGHSDAVSVLGNSGADPNALTKSMSTPLHFAAMMGHEEAVRHLLQLGCNFGMRNASGLSAAALACCFGHTNILMQLLSHALIKCQFIQPKVDRNNPSEILGLPGGTDEMLQNVYNLLTSADNSVRQSDGCDNLDDEVQSIALHSALQQAGFLHNRATMQSAIADVLQDLMRKRFNNQDYIVGSYADGWGNSLVCLNGTIDMDADIDLTQLLTSRIFHLTGHCDCTDMAPNHTLSYDNGHVLHLGLESKPANTYIGSPMRPAIDYIRAYRCCKYPRIEVLEQEYVTQISQSVLETLRQELLTSPCHLVTAAPPGEEGQQLRISTSFLERKLMRSLTSVQGQVFVLLKYIVKKVIAAKVIGLKTYQAKTLIFYLLDETPADVWQPCHLLSLTRQGLQKLLGCLQDGSDPNQCMRHFFIRDAWLYLKKGHSEKKEIATYVKNIIKKLPRIICHLKINLRALTGQGAFTFHPFLILPNVQPRPVSESGIMQYHEISDTVRCLLLKLSQENCSRDLLSSLLTSIRRLPDCAVTARQSLRALTYLKFGMHNEACRVLRESIGHQVSRGIPCPSGLSRDAACVELVRQSLESSDSAWKFCFWFDRRPTLEFLPEFMRLHFPTGMQSVEMYFVNFIALLRCLCLHLGVADAENAQSWFENVLRREDPDVQELLMTLEFCKDMELVVQLIHRHKRVICDLRATRCKVENLITQPLLMTLCINRTLEKALAEPADQTAELQIGD